MTIGERIDHMNPQRCLICDRVVSVARDWPICPACKFDQVSPEAYTIRRARGLLWRFGLEAAPKTRSATFATQFSSLKP
jgi:hypothetical protein